MSWEEEVRMEEELWMWKRPVIDELPLLLSHFSLNLYTYFWKMKLNSKRKFRHKMIGNWSLILNTYSSGFMIIVPPNPCGVKHAIWNPSLNKGDSSPQNSSMRFSYLNKLAPTYYRVVSACFSVKRGKLCCVHSTKSHQQTYIWSAFMKRYLPGINKVNPYRRKLLISNKRVK